MGEESVMPSRAPPIAPVRCPQEEFFQLFSVADGESGQAVGHGTGEAPVWCLA